MTTQPCPACGGRILVVEGSRHGGQKEAFDPAPGTGERFNTKLSRDLTHIEIKAAGTANLMGRVPLYRPHRYTCTAAMRIPGDQPLPHVGGYAHAAAPRKDTLPVPELTWPGAWEGVTVKTCPEDDLLSLDPAAVPRRRLMVQMALVQYRSAAGMAARRMQNPQPGDLVVDTAGARKPGGEIKGFGILIARRRELDAADVWYVQYGSSENDVERSEGGSWIAVLADDRAFEG